MIEIAGPIVDAIRSVKSRLSMNLMQFSIKFIDNQNFTEPNSIYNWTGIFYHFFCPF